MTSRVLSAAALLVVCMVFPACGGSPTSPDSSTSSSSTVTPPASGELIGHITDTYTSKDLAGVLVTVISAANSGKTATTDSSGTFRLSGMDLSGTTTVRATFTGYDPFTVSVTGTSQNIVNMKLTPSTTSVVTDSVTETIAPTDAACTGGTGACKSYQIVTHAQGAWDATLTWVDPSVTLSLELWQNNVRVQPGTSSAARTVRLQANLAAGAWELRVKYTTGAASTSFTLSGTRPS